MLLVEASESFKSKYEKVAIGGSYPLSWNMHEKVGEAAS